MEPITYHLAQVNIARMRAPLESPIMADFVAQLDAINALADGSPGFVWRLQSDDGNATALRPFDDDFILVNMSLWESIEDLRAYVFKSAHAAVMRRRREWFEQFGSTYVALWWVEAGHLPTVGEAKQRLRHLEELQIHHQEGPCIAAFDDKELVAAEDLTKDSRWPAFSAAAVARGVRAVLASPVPYNQDAVGVVAVLSEKRRPWSAEEELAVLAFTDLAAVLVASMMQGQQQSELAAQLQGALNSRAVIEQAKGVLIGQQGLSARAAYEQLRALARAERRKLVAVSAELVRNAHATSERLACRVISGILDGLHDAAQTLAVVRHVDARHRVSPTWRRSDSPDSGRLRSRSATANQEFSGSSCYSAGLLTKIATKWQRHDNESRTASRRNFR
jgi:GAF domain-containing protein